MTETSIWDKIFTESSRLMRGALIPQRIPSRAPHRNNRVDCGGTARYSGQKAHKCAKQGGPAVIIALEPKKGSRAFFN